MSYDKGIAARIRAHFADIDGVVEQQMMGALCFMVQGHMCCGVTGDHLMIRVGFDGYADALAEPHVVPLAMAGRTPRGFVLVSPKGVESEADMTKWIARGRAFVRTLPLRAPKS